MENTIELLNSNSTTYYIICDINIDLLKTNHDVKISHNFNTLDSLGCSQVIAHPIRITATSSKLLDHIYTNNSFQHINSHAIISDISDHLPVTALVKNFKLLNTPFRFYKRDTRNFVLDDFLSEVSDFCNGFLHLNDNMSGDDLFVQFLSTFSDIVNKHPPLKLSCRSEQKRKHKPCITKGLLKSIKHKKKTLQNYAQGKHAGKCSTILKVQKQINTYKRTSKEKQL